MYTGPEHEKITCPKCSAPNTTAAIFDGWMTHPTRCIAQFTCGAGCKFTREYPADNAPTKPFNEYKF